MAGAILKKLKLIPMRDSSKEKFLLRISESVESENSALVMPVSETRVVTSDVLPYPGALDSLSKNYIVEKLKEHAGNLQQFKQDVEFGDVFHRFMIKYVERVGELLDTTDDALLLSLPTPVVDVTARTDPPPSGGFQTDAPNYISSTIESQTLQSTMYPNSGGESVFSPFELPTETSSFFDLNNFTINLRTEFEDAIAPPLLKDEGMGEAIDILEQTAKLLIAAVALIPADIVSSPDKIASAVLSEDPAAELTSIIFAMLSEDIFRGIKLAFPESKALADPLFFSKYTTVLSYILSYSVLSVIGKLIGTGQISEAILALFDIE